MASRRQALQKRSAVAKRPHILLIVTDQQRGDCLGLDGHPVLSTPNMDELGASGAFFRHGYSEVPSCIPARRILISGQNQVSTGMVGMQGSEEFKPPHTVAGELTKAGYQTHLVGKLHQFPFRKRYGFESMVKSDGPLGEFNPEKEPDDYHTFLGRHGYLPSDAMAHGLDPNGWVGRPWHLSERLHFTNWCVDESIDFLKRRDPTVPFFLKLSIFAPHPPLIPPQLYYDRYMQMDLPPAAIGDWVDAEHTPGTGVEGARVSASRVRIAPDALIRCRAAYYGLVNHIDDQLGCLFTAMRRMGLLNDTFILFTSDHGEMLGDHHMYRKTFAYEASARVPFLARAPQWMGCHAGQRLNQVVGLQDVAPTLLDAAGAAIPSSMDGRSVLPLMRGEQPAWREFLHGEHSGCYRNEDGMHYLTDGKEKYIWYSQTGQEQLFDLLDDPCECVDLARQAQNAQRVAPWRKRLVAQLKDRPEGFSDGKKLIAGRPHEYLIPAGK